MFFLVLENIVSCILISLVASAILIFICGMLPKWILPRFSYNALHYGLLLLAAIVLFAQIFLFVGASYVKSYLSKAEDGIVSAKELLTEYPAITEYTDAYISADNVQEQMHEILSPVNEYFTSYMWKRVIWSIVTIALLITFFIYQIKVQGRKGTSNVGRRSPPARRNRYDF